MKASTTVTLVGVVSPVEGATFPSSIFLLFPNVCLLTRPIRASGTCTLMWLARDGVHAITWQAHDSGVCSLRRLACTSAHTSGPLCA